jgi:hypothetical protein
MLLSNALACNHTTTYLLPITQVVDASHAFCALDTHLSQAPPTLFYTATLMKHAGCGANAALMLVPKEQHSKMRPLWTGWMASTSRILLCSHVS